jgi:hypothetical protein
MVKYEQQMVEHIGTGHVGTVIRGDNGSSHAPSRVWGVWEQLGPGNLALEWVSFGDDQAGGWYDVISDDWREVGSPVAVDLPEGWESPGGCDDGCAEYCCAAEPPDIEATFIMCHQCKEGMLGTRGDGLAFCFVCKETASLSVMEAEQASTKPDMRLSTVAGFLMLFPR